MGGVVPGEKVAFRLSGKCSFTRKATFLSRGKLSKSRFLRCLCEIRVLLNVGVATIMAWVFQNRFSLLLLAPKLLKLQQL